MNRREFLMGSGGAVAALSQASRAARPIDTSPPPNTAAQSEGYALAEKLVAAMGGRDNWNPLLGLSIRARHFEVSVPEPYENALFIALAEPRMRFEGRSSSMTRIRAVIGNRGWRVSEVSPIGPLSPEIVRSDLEWWETHAYRNIWRLARRDPTLVPRRHADGRLELYRPNGTRLMWYRLNLAGEPVAFGRFDSDTTATILGPLQDIAGGARLPMFSTSSDGTFRAVDQRGTVYTSLPPVDWDKP